MALGEDLEAVLDAWPEAGDEDLDEAEDALGLGVAREALGTDILEEGGDEDSDREERDGNLDEEDNEDEDKDSDKDNLGVI